MGATATVPATGSQQVLERIRDLRGIAQRLLVRMYRPDAQVYAFKLQRHPDRIALEGVSRRYTAICLIGFATEAPADAARMLHGGDPRDVCDRLCAAVGESQELGEVALTLWAARRWNRPLAASVLRRLRQLDPGQRVYPTVESSWCVTALSIPSNVAGDDALRDALAQRLLRTQNGASGLFSHWVEGRASSRLRGHVTCYADFVYPIQALSHYYRATRQQVALDAAARAGARMVELQGPAGQWWWHFDSRTGRVVEGFPVYAVHQHSMGPMALAALRDAGGPDYPAALEKCLGWLYAAPELGGGSLVDRENDLVWRKVARREPNKLVRGMQALASGVHAGLRVPGVDLIFRPGGIDFEVRPYEMGWILHAFPGCNT